jgi:UDP-2,3-diacylglucosamine pyrophosphatase LpxH
MLVVISDVHMTDRTTGGPVTDRELVGFVEEIGKLKPGGKPLTLLLLGDMFDYLRSELWSELFEKHPGCVPWTNAKENFANFADSHQEAQLLRIQEGIEQRYQQFSKALKDLKKLGGLTIRYVFGNHDYMLQLSPPTRERVVRFLSLDENPTREFPMEYEDKKLSVYAEHGHRYDDYNWHQREAGLWAIGDAIVIRVVNRFGELAAKELNLTNKMALGRAVHEIDNIEAYAQIPLYVEWLAKSSLANKVDRDRLYACWQRTVAEFLALPEFQERKYGSLASKIGLLRKLYGVFDDKKIAKMLPGFKTNYAQKAYLETTTNAILRVYGHTHEPGIHPLDEVAGQRRYYANTGTWRRVVAPLDIGRGEMGFGGSRVASYLVVRGPGDFVLHTRASAG